MNIIFIGVTITVVTVIAVQARKLYREEAAMQELDAMLEEILGDCLEAYCDDCEHVLAQGTGVHKDMVADEAYNHSEVYDHMVHLRSWADL